MANIIEEYLVSLGWYVDQREMRLFSEALRTMAAQVDKYTNSPFSGIGPMFLKAGAAITGVLASITAGTVGLLDHTAQADLDFQMLARRMFTSAEAARSMKIATEALGYSLEEVVWGPPELRQRYGELLNLQGTLTSGLGPDFEKQMRRIRDIRFEFTKLGIEAQYFVMGVSGKIAKALFGDDLLGKMKQLNEWFVQHMPQIEQAVSNELVPVLKDVGAIIKDVWEVIKQADWKRWADDLVYLTHKLRELVDFVTSSPAAMRILGWTAAGAAAGSVIPGVGTGLGALVGGTTAAIDNVFRPDKAAPKEDAVRWAIRAAAIKYKIDEALLTRLFTTESSLNPLAVNKESGAMGLGQLMAGTAKRYGIQDPFDAWQNADASAHYLRDLLNQFNGDTAKALSTYGGFKTKDPSSYIDSVMGPKFQPQAYHGGGDIHLGGIHVNVAHTNATAEEIGHAAARSVEDRLKAENLRIQVQNGGVFA